MQKGFRAVWPWRDETQILLSWNIKALGSCCRWRYKLGTTSLSPDRTEALLNMTRSKISDTVGASMSEIQVPTNLGPSRAAHQLSVYLEEHSLTDRDAQSGTEACRKSGSTFANFILMQVTYLLIFKLKHSSFSLWQSLDVTIVKKSTYKQNQTSQTNKKKNPMKKNPNAWTVKLCILLFLYEIWTFCEFICSTQPCTRSASSHTNPQLCGLGICSPAAAATWQRGRGSGDRALGDRFVTSGGI